LEIVVPDRMLRQTALRRDERVLPVVLDAHERRLAQLAGLVPARGHHDDRQARVAQRVGPTAAGGLVLRYLLAHPGVRARLVLTFKRGHGTHLPETGCRLARDAATDVDPRGTIRRVPEATAPRSHALTCEGGRRGAADACYLPVVR